MQGAPAQTGTVCESTKFTPSPGRCLNVTRDGMLDCVYLRRGEGAFGSMGCIRKIGAAVSIRWRVQN